MARSLGWLAAGCAMAMTTMVAGAISVPLTVTERAGVARTGEIAAGGVPLPLGAAKDTSSFGVVDERGQAMPAQFTVLNRWPDDGSVRWMLVEFPVTITPGATRTFTLKEGAGNPLPAEPLRVDSPGRRLLTVWQGNRPRIRVEREGGKILIQGMEDGFAITTSTGETYTTALDSEARLTVEEAGPLHAVVRLDGHHRNAKGEALFSYRIRIHAFADVDALRVQYTFTHDAGPFSNTPVDVKELSLNMNVEEEGPFKAFFGGSGKTYEAELKKTDTLRLAALSSEKYVLTGALADSGPAKAAKDLNLGWCALSNGKFSGLAAVRWFWQLNPKALLIGGDGTIKVELVPPDAPEPVHVYRGMSKTHEILLRGDEGPRPAHEAAIGFQQPLFVKCPPAWYGEETLGFGRLLSTNSPHLAKAAADFDRKVAAGFEEQIKVIRDWRSRIVDPKRGVDSYGFFHFGDGFHTYAGGGHRGVEWDNCYYSYTHLLAMQYARSASDAILDTLREAAAFEGDAAIGWTTTDLAGPRQNPGKYHVGGFGSFNNHISGTWSFYKPIGMMEAFYLTGDRRYQDAGLANFNWLLHNDGYDMYNNPRSAGAGLRACIHGYLATGNRDFLEVGRDVARKSERFYRVHGHFAPIQNSIFMCPNALSGLCTYHEYTGDQHLGKVLPDIVAAHVKAFARDPGNLAYGYMNLYSACLSGDEEGRKRVAEGLAGRAGFGIQRGEHHVKDFASGKREVPLIFWYLSDLATSPPKPWGKVAFGPDRPDRVEVARMPAPTLDGRLADGEWGRAAVIDLVSSPVVTRSPQAPTRLRLGCDAENLYLAVEAREPRLDLLKTDVKEDGGATYGDDCVEIYVGPNARRYGVKLAVNAAGVRMVSMRGHERGKHPAPPPADFPVAAGRTAEAWTLEVVIPWAKLGMEKPAAGTEVAFNVLRFRVTSGAEKPGETSTWHGTSNQLESVGTLVLAK